MWPDTNVKCFRILFGIRQKIWYKIYIHGGPFFGPEKCLKELILTWWVCFENPILVHSIFSSKCMIMCPNPILVHFSIVQISDFGPDFYFEMVIGAKSEIWTIEKWTKIGFGHVIIYFVEKIEWAKIGFSAQAHHVRMNSFKHFSGLKKGPPRNQPRKIVTKIPHSGLQRPIAHASLILSTI